MTLTHALGCLMPTPKLDTSGYFRCPQCHYDQPRPQASTQPSNYVCRIHNGEPVSWKGSGCTRCAVDAKKPKRDDEELWP